MMKFAAFKNYLDADKVEIGFLSLIFTVPLYTGFFGVTVAFVLFFTLLRLLNERTISTFTIDWFLPLLFAYFFLSGIATGEPWTAMEKRLPLLVMPVVFALNRNLLSLRLRNKVLMTFILGNILAIIICFVRAVIRSITFQDGAWGFDSRVYPDTGYDILTSSVMGGNYFFGSEFSYFFDQVTYFGIYIVIAQVFAYFLYRTSRSRRLKIVLIAIYLLFAGVLFLLSSKAALITSFAFTFFVLVTVRIPNSLKLVVIVIFLSTGVFSFTTNPRSKVFLEDFVQSVQQIDPNAKYGHRLRILSWDAALEVIKHKWLLGVGEGNKEAVLVKMYDKKKYIFPAERRYNSHNQYLDFVLGGGIILLAFFIFGITVFVTRGVKHHNQLLLFFLGIIVFNLLFENLLSRHAGIVIFSTFLGYLSGLRCYGDPRTQQPVINAANHP